MARSSHDRKEEALGILMVAVGVLVLVSLLPRLLLEQLGAGAGSGYGNPVGLAGKFVNESLKDLLGVLAYAVPVLITAWGWRIFRGKPSPVYTRITVYSLVAGLGLAILLGLGRIGQAGEAFDFGPGRLGGLLALWLHTALGTVGAYTVTVASLLVFLVVYTGLSLRSAAEGLEKAGHSVGSAIGRIKLPRPEKKKKPAGKKTKKKDKAEDTPEPVKQEAETASGFDDEPEQDMAVEEDFQFSLGPELDGLEEEPAGSPGEPVERPTRPVAESTDSEQDYSLPAIDLLEEAEKERKVVSREELERMGEVLVSKLADFNVEGELVNITRGPQVSTFEIRPAPGVKVNRIAALSDDLAMAMHAKRVRILAPIPGKGAVGVELPNPVLEMVSARDVLDSPGFRDSELYIPIGLGKDLEGNIRVTDLTRMPHLLIAGTTGSGKSVCMNMIVASILFTFGPEAVRMLMIDPKMIELNLYNGIPHLLHPVVTDAKEAAGVFKWAVFEMERRYRLLSRNSVRNIEDYNFKLESGNRMRGVTDDPAEPAERMPYVIILVDELSDLMCSDVKNEIEASLVRLAQMARAVGIHLVVATQRPSVDVITGLIKANFPSRLSFQVYSRTDSRTILDAGGAEQLLRNGDMLFAPAGRADPVRIQGAYLSSEEVERLAEHWKSQPVTAGEEEEDSEGQEPEGLEARLKEQLEGGAGPLDDDEERDELFDEAARLVVRHDLGSTSLIQRRLKVGYARAGRIVDQLERAGILGPPDGSKPRDVLISEEDLADYGIE